MHAYLWVVLSKKIVSGSFPTVYKELLRDRECALQLLLGDSAYSLLPYLMKEYGISIQQATYVNQMLRSARNEIECSVGRLKVRW